MIIDNPEKNHVPALRKLWQQAFGDTDAFLDKFFSAGFSPARCRCVFVGGMPVAAHYLFDCRWQGKKIAYMYALAVEKSHRGKGLSRLLMTDTHRYLQENGYAGVLLEPADDGLRQYYATFGYADCGGRTEITCRAGSTRIPLCRLDAPAYEQAREKWLPDGGVRQSGVMTAFLHTYTDFIGSEDFVAAVSRTEAVITEFLGNREKLPGLLAALECKQAAVRVPGKEKTAMYLSLTGEAEKPAYFGLPLD